MFEATRHGHCRYSSFHERHYLDLAEVGASERLDSVERVHRRRWVGGSADGQSLDSLQKQRSDLGSEIILRQVLIDKSLRDTQF